eukprot:Tbor_TRINITY_DN5555_c3_g2::TRINITY_DN5555_c3_g2_i1::g.13289::m.13289
MIALHSETNDMDMQRLTSPTLLAISRNPTFSIILSVLFILVARPPYHLVDALNMTISTKKDKRRVVDFGTFGYGGDYGGKLDLSVEDFVIHDLEEYDSNNARIGFALDWVESAKSARKEKNQAVAETKKNLNDNDEENACFGGTGTSPGSSSNEDKKIYVSSSIRTSTSDNNIKSLIKLFPSAAGHSISSPGGPSKSLASSDSVRYIIPLEKFLAAAKREAENEIKKDYPDGVPTETLRRYIKNAIEGKSVTVTISPRNPGYYALFFYNCKKANMNSRPVPVSFTIKISQYNIVSADLVDMHSVTNTNVKEVSFLSFGDTALPSIYLGMCVVFLIFTFVWHFLLFKNSSEKVRRNVRLIHKLMYALIVLKSATLLFNSLMLSQRKSTGKMNSTIDYVFYMMQFLKGFSLFTTILLLGSGFSLIKSFLSVRDRIIFFAMLPLQLITNITIALIDENSEGSMYWSWWRDTLWIIDVVCCIVVLLPVVTSIYSLRSTNDRDARRNVKRLRFFFAFYIITLLFIYMTRIMLTTLASSVAYDKTWVPPLLTEVSALIYYIITGWLFRPNEAPGWEPASIYDRAADDHDKNSGDDDEDLIREMEDMDELDLSGIHRMQSMPTASIHHHHSHFGGSPMPKEPRDVRGGVSRDSTAVAMLGNDVEEIIVKA